MDMVEELEAIITGDDEDLAAVVGKALFAIALGMNQLTSRLDEMAQSVVRLEAEAQRDRQ